MNRYRVDLEAIDAVGVPALLDALRQGRVVVVELPSQLLTELRG